MTLPNDRYTYTAPAAVTCADTLRMNGIPAFVHDRCTVTVEAIGYGLHRVGEPNVTRITARAPDGCTYVTHTRFSLDDALAWRIRRDALIQAACTCARFPPRLTQ